MPEDNSMLATDYEDLKLLSVWISPPKNDLAQLMRQMVADNINSTLYYIDATNRFPLKEFQLLVSPNSKEIYDRVRIITCLDLTELAVTIDKVIQVLNMGKIQQHQKQTHNDATQTNHRRVKILLVLQGFEIMFRNTQLKCSPSESHLALRDLLLKLRATANSTIPNSPMLRTILTFPREELFKFTNRQGSDIKRLKGALISGNTLGEYVAKFYADIVI